MILILTDKLGITHGYRPEWGSLCNAAGLGGEQMLPFNMHEVLAKKGLQLLTKKGNQKALVFNSDPAVMKAITLEINRFIGKDAKTPCKLIICQDAACLGLITDDWRLGSIDKLRGGVYNYRGVPFVIVPPVSAVNTQVLTKDVKILNEGFESKEDWDDSDHEDGSVFNSPYIVKSGKWILHNDLCKVSRIIQKNCPVPASGNPYPWEIVTTDAGVARAREFLMESTLIANDVETWPDLKLMSVNGYTGVHKDGTINSFVFPFSRTRSPESAPWDSHTKAIEFMREVNLSGIPFTYHNAGYDLYWLTRYRMPVANYAFDSMTMFWSLYPELPKTLAFVSSILLDDYQYWKGDGKSMDQETYLMYNMRDNVRTLQNTLKLLDILRRSPKAMRNFTDAHRRVVSCLQMSLWGVKGDMKIRDEMGVRLKEDAATALEELRYLVADSEFNYRSPPQMKELLYGLLGARTRNARGRPTRSQMGASTGAVVRRYIEEEGPIQKTVCKAITKAMSPAKQISNVINMKLTPGNRFYTSYNAIGTVTSRLASSESPLKVGSNAQNIKKAYRGWLVPDNEDSFLMEVDFSASDDVIVSFESADPEKIKLFRSGKDVHAANVALLFTNWLYEDVVAGKKAGDPRVVHPVRGIRNSIKKVSHGSNYLMAPTTLLQSVGVTSLIAAALEKGYADANSWKFDRQKDFCSELERLYRAHYKRLSSPGTPGSWYNDLQEEARRTGGFTTPFGYYQRFLADPSSHDVLRALAATAGQAGTAGRINMAFDEFNYGHIEPEFRDGPNPSYGVEPLQISEDLNGCRIILQTHDSFTFHVNRRHPDWKIGVERIHTVMQRPIVIKNKLTEELEEFHIGIEAEVGYQWGKGLSEYDVTSHQSLLDALKR